MMPEELPNCICGAHKWNPNGGSFGSDLSSQAFECDFCKRRGYLVSTCGGSGFFLPVIGKELGHDEYDYFNDTLFVAWRDRYDKMKKFRDKWESEEWERKCRLLNLSACTPEEQVDEKRKFYEECNRSEEWIQAGFLDPCLPPQMPESILCFVQNKHGWGIVTSAQTKHLEVPVDPIYRDHLEFFKDAFGMFCMRASLGSKYGIWRQSEYDLWKTIHEINNEYCGAKNQPWYTFSLNEVEYTVGPRKRVIAIQAKGDLYVKEIRELAKSDKVTYWADDGWQSDKDRAESIEVHAWGKEKLVEYLLCIYRTSGKKETQIESLHT